MDRKNQVSLIAFFLLAADRQDHLDEEILPALENDHIVISDRYYHSSLAYQGLSVGFSKVAALNETFRKPDITFFLWLEPETVFFVFNIEANLSNDLKPLIDFETLLKHMTVSFHTAVHKMNASSKSMHNSQSKRSMCKCKKSFFPFFLLYELLLSHRVA